jgi:Fic family protein
MLKSQFPYNELKSIQDWKFVPNDSLKLEVQVFENSLNYLKGYLDALQYFDLKAFNQMIKLNEMKHSYDLENIHLSQQRLFESYASENALNDDLARQMIDDLKQYDWLFLDDLTLFQSKIFDHKRQKRTKKEPTIKSYHTNLTLYTCPNSPLLIKNLTNALINELDEFKQNPTLIALPLLHLQIRGLGLYPTNNGHSARLILHAMLQLFIKQVIVLPLSKAILENKEDYQVLLKKALLDQQYHDWCVFIIQQLNKSAFVYIEKLKKYMQLRQQVDEMIQKYTAYKMPSPALLNTLFHSPYIKPKHLMDALKCHRHTAYTYLEHLVKMGILIEKKSGRERLFLNKGLMDVLI